MEMRFGNLTISEFEKKTEVTFSERDKQWLSEHRQNNARVDDTNKFHIYELPLGIIAGSDCVEELIKRLKNYSFKRSFPVEA